MTERDQVWHNVAHTLWRNMMPPPVEALRGGNAAFLRATAALRKPRLADDWFPPPAPALPAAGGDGADGGDDDDDPPPAWATDLTNGTLGGGGDGSDNAAVVRAILAAPSRRDASVAPCAQTRGGARAAGARWRRYVMYCTVL